jgi:hypothetical protein
MSVGLTPLDDDRWQLRLAASELAALQGDWARVAGPAPGHDFRRGLIRARGEIEAAAAALAAGRRPAPGWRERAGEHMRAARRALVRRQLAYYGAWWPAERRYLG